MSRWREAMRGGKKRKVTELKGGGEVCGEKRRMTYFGEIKARRVKRYLLKKRVDDGARLGRMREENVCEINSA